MNSDFLTPTLDLANMDGIQAFILVDALAATNIILEQKALGLVLIAPITLMIN
jgi:hypothetical protein